MRISSIDIGSNAIRQLIAEIGPDGSLKILKKHREMIRLGADVFHGGLIQEHTQKRLVIAFRRMALLSRKFKVDRQIAYATSAFRGEVCRTKSFELGLFLEGAVNLHTGFWSNTTTISCAVQSPWLVGRLYLQSQ